jgi:hypothetical protein
MEFSYFVMYRNYENSQPDNLPISFTTSNTFPNLFCCLICQVGMYTLYTIVFQFVHSEMSCKVPEMKCVFFEIFLSNNFGIKEKKKDLECVLMKKEFQRQDLRRGFYIHANRIFWMKTSFGNDFLWKQNAFMNRIDFVVVN